MTVTKENGVVIFIACFFWLSGIVLAKGFVSTACAIWLPPWAWYLAVEGLLVSIGVVT